MGFLAPENSQRSRFVWKGNNPVLYLKKCNTLQFLFYFSRDVALEILQQEDIGSFIVRDSSTHPGCYALSVRVPKFENPTGISHYLILKTQRGVKLKVSCETGAHSNGIRLTQDTLLHKY